jgi:hypothetical protein
VICNIVPRAPTAAKYGIYRSEPTEEKQKINIIL